MLIRKFIPEVALLGYASLVQDREGKLFDNLVFVILGPSPLVILSEAKNLTAQDRLRNRRISYSLPSYRQESGLRLRTAYGDPSLCSG